MSATKHSATKHLTLQEFEAIDMPFGGAITPRQAEGRANSDSVSTNSVDKAAQFSHMARFGSLQPGVQCLRLSSFEHGDKLLAQEVDGTEFLVAVHLLNLLLLHLGEVRGG